MTLYMQLHFLMPVSGWVNTPAYDLLHAASLSWCLYLCGSALVCRTVHIESHFLDACIYVGQHLVLYLINAASLS
jgi:hypothetical protein